MSRTTALTIASLPVSLAMVAFTVLAGTATDPNHIAAFCFGAAICGVVTMTAFVLIYITPKEKHVDPDPPGLP